jgi:predicted nucleotidyltransferase
MSEQTLIETICSFYPEVQAIYLFGSYGTEYENQISDVDIAVLLPPDLAKREKSLVLKPCHDALVIFFRRSVDLINLREVSTVFQNEIINTGKRVFMANENAVHEFEMLVWSFYQKLNEERREILADFFRTKRAYKV